MVVFWPRNSDPRPAPTRHVPSPREAGGVPVDPSPLMPPPPPSAPGVASISADEAEGDPEAAAEHLRVDGALVVRGACAINVTATARDHVHEVLECALRNSGECDTAIAYIPWVRHTPPSSCALHKSAPKTPSTLPDISSPHCVASLSHILSQSSRYKSRIPSEQRNSFSDYSQMERTHEHAEANHRWFSNVNSGGHRRDLRLQMAPPIHAALHQVLGRA